MRLPLLHVVILLAASVLIFSCVQFFKVTVAQQKFEKAQVKRRENEAFEHGFYAGARAVTKIITFDTNTGKFTLELTNLFNALREVENENARSDAGKPGAANRRN